MPESQHPNSKLYLLHEEVINREIEKRKGRWRLSLAFYSWEDCKQDIKKRILIKIASYDENKSQFSHWANTVITNAIWNILRDKYDSFKRPCLICPHNGGGNVCTLFGKQSNLCKDFDKWDKGKRYKMEIKINASSLDSTIQNEEHDNIRKQIEDKQSTFLDFEKVIPEFNTLMHTKLNKIEWKVYTFLYIDNLSELETAREMGYSTKEKNKSPGYKQLQKLKIRIYEKAKKVVEQLNF